MLRGQVIGDDPRTTILCRQEFEAAPFLADADPAGSIYAQLAAKGLSPASCDQTVEATLPTEEVAKAFGFEEPFPCLLIKRKMYLQSGVMLNMWRELFVATPMFIVSILTLNRDV